MRNIATCYSEHAVRVSDSYCSGPLTKSSYVSPKTIPSIQNAVSHTYKAKLSSSISHKQRPFFITITWCDKLICQGFFIKVSEKNMSKSGPHRQVGKPKGHKFLDFDKEVVSTKVEVYWDLTLARFGSGPVPLDSFYIMIVFVDFNSALLIGDKEGDPYVVELLTRRSLGGTKPTSVSQYEQHIGHWSNPISTLARFSQAGVEHEITIRCSLEEDGPKNPVLSVFVDKKRVVKVKGLQWNFRGNQVIFLDGLLVDVMWDVFGWYFDDQNNNNYNGINNNSKGGGSGLFLFRTRSGLDSRLWLEEEERKKSADKDYDRPEFSLLICVSSKKPG